MPAFHLPKTRPVKLDSVDWNMDLGTAFTMSEIVLLENAAPEPDHWQSAQLWFADNGLRTMRGCRPRAAQEAVAELLKLVQEQA